MVLHVVLFKWKDGVDPGAVEAVRQAVLGLQARIPGIQGVTWGGNTSPEGLSRGYDVGFVMTFADAAARDAYLPHPEHEAVHPLIDAIVADVLVFDIAS
jgi:hypothetical protein